MSSDTRKSYRAPDGVVWGVDVEMPSFSSALVIFRYPDLAQPRRHRYATLNSQTSEASDPRARLDSSKVLASLTDREMARLFRRSMPIQTERPSYIAS